MTECRHGLSEDCPGCMQETIDALVKALEDIKRATIEGRVCDDVAWFDSITTLHDFCEIAIDRVSAPAQCTPTYPAEEYAKVAMGNAIEVGRLHILVERMTRAIKAANTYYGCYVQDEAEELECCISQEQHEAAKELRDALRIAVSALTSTVDQPIEKTDGGAS